MRLTLDHIAVAAETLEEGVAWAEERLGLPLLAGGQHDHYGTHNRLLALAPGLYLEVIAKTPDAAPTGRVTWFGLDDFRGPPRLANWICRAEDLARFVDITGPAVPLARGALRWDITVPDDGCLPMQGGFPTLLRWAEGVTPPGQSLPASGCRLTRLTVTHPQAAWLRETLAVDSDLVVFAQGDPALAAEIDTPAGLCRL